ncbi:MAG TPA: electron transfer flavoprotein subunit alpha/FixB family protein [Bryobacteraceae bacterium]|nr:electron transfer flavoprotein subunit alpha/FixB family protein [Bryobacteraceae bacterium]
MSVLVVLEHMDGKWNRMSFEALEAARKVAQELNTALEAVVLGSGIDSLGADVAAYEVSKVWTINDPLLQAYTPDGYTAALEQLIKHVQPGLVLFPHTYQVRDYAPKLAARFGKALVSDVVDVRADGQDVLFVRQLFQGKLNADVKVKGEPRFASIQAGAFRAAQGGPASAPIENFGVQLRASDIRSKPEAPFRDAQRSVDLGAANIIVSVGRGIKEKENIPIVEELAQVLGGELAASRPICDNGWLPMERQVGSSGQTVSPKLYLAVGISGAIQHLVGMKGAKTVVAINKDESAPIFETADYGIAGDLFEVVPALVEEFKKVKG